MSSSATWVIREYTEHCLRRKLSGRCAGIGRAGWAWFNSGTLCRGFIMVWNCTEDDQMRPYIHGQKEAIEWWAIIWLENDGAEYFPMYCPALGWQRSKPWLVHRSRVYRCPPHWLEFSSSSSSISSSSQASTFAVASTSSAWNFVPSNFVPSPDEMAGWNIIEPAPSVADLADFDDDDDAATAISEATWSGTSSASSSASTAASTAASRTKRWGNKKDQNDKNNGT